jgi:hypothetical protein
VGGCTFQKNIFSRKKCEKNISEEKYKEKIVFEKVVFEK